MARVVRPSVPLLVTLLAVAALAAPAFGERPSRRGPPPEALSACEGAAEEAACSFTSPRGDEVAGSCRTVRDGDVACVPEGGPRGRRPRGGLPQDEQAL